MADISAESGISASQTLINLSATHEVTAMNIISSSKIEKKVTRALEILSVYPTPDGEKPRVVMLHAKAAVGTKVISIAEITKRDIAKEGKWFQYTCVESLMEEVKAKPSKDVEKDMKGEADGGEERGEGEGEESEEETTAFETMKTPWERANEGKVKVRAVPVIRVYLARFRIESLRKAYG
jgi:hypothetical protein